MMQRICLSLRQKCTSQPRMMRQFSSSVVYHEHGHPLDVLKVEKAPKLPSLSANQVQVQMLAAPINPADLNMVEGGYGIVPQFPAVGGNEGVAVVKGIGANVKNVQVGDHVIPTQAAFGTWRNEAVAEAEDVMTVPKELPVELAATLAVNPCTAYRLLNDFADLKEGDVIVQNGANSAVGQAVVQLAALRGIKTINIMRNNDEYEKMNDRLKNLGGHIVCISDYTNSSEFRQLISDLPAPKLGLNCTGGSDATNVARILGKGATMVTYGGMSRKPVTIPTSCLIFNDISLRGFWLSEWVRTHSVEERKQMLSELSDLALQGKLLSFVERYAFDDFEEALSAAKDRRTRRKVLLMMDKSKASKVEQDADRSPF